MSLCRPLISVICTMLSSQQQRAALPTRPMQTGQHIHALRYLHASSLGAYRSSWWRVRQAAASGRPLTCGQMAAQGSGSSKASRDVLGLTTADACRLWAQMHNCMRASSAASCQASRCRRRHPVALEAGSMTAAALARNGHLAADSSSPLGLHRRSSDARPSSTQHLARGVLKGGMLPVHNGRTVTHSSGGGWHPQGITRGCWRSCRLALWQCPRPLALKRRCARRTHVGAAAVRQNRDACAAHREHLQYTNSWLAAAVWDHQQDLRNSCPSGWRGADATACCAITDAITSPRAQCKQRCSWAASASRPLASLQMPAVKQLTASAGLASC